METWNGGHLEGSGKPFTYLNLELVLKDKRVLDRKHHPEFIES